MEPDVDLVAPHAADGLLEVDVAPVHGLAGETADLVREVLGRDAAEELALLPGLMADPNRHLRKPLRRGLGLRAGLGRPLIVGPLEALGVANGALGGRD